MSSQGRDKFECPICKKLFSFKQSLNKHWKAIHKLGLEELKVPKCSKKGKLLGPSTSDPAASKISKVHKKCELNVYL